MSDWKPSKPRAALPATARGTELSFMALLTLRDCPPAGSRPQAEAVKRVGEPAGGWRARPVPAPPWPSIVTAAGLYLGPFQWGFLPCA